MKLITVLKTASIFASLQAYSAIMFEAGDGEFDNAVNFVGSAFNFNDTSINDWYASDSGSFGWQLDSGADNVLTKESGSFPRVRGLAYVFDDNDESIGANIQFRYSNSATGDISVGLYGFNDGESGQFDFADGTGAVIDHASSSFFGINSGTPTLLGSTYLTSVAIGSEQLFTADYDYSAFGTFDNIALIIYRDGFAPGGSVSFDSFSATGVAVPEPGSFALLGLVGILTGISFRRKFIL